MAPTIAELIFYIIAGIVAIIFFIKILFSAPSNDEIKITWGQRRDWERREKDGRL